jgi:predicted NBD/HSP70 family sugar kinase
MEDTAAARVSTPTVDAVLGALYGAGAVSRAEIGATTGLSRPSVSAAVAELLAAGLVEEIAEPATGRGRPSRLVRLSTRRADAVGIELGRAHVAVAIADPAGRVAATAAIDSDPTTSLLDRAVAAVDLIEETAATHGIELAAVRRVAVGTPGPRFVSAGGHGTGGHGAGPSPTARPETPAAFDVARLERERTAVATLVGRRFDVPVDVGNNTRWTAVAEAHRRGRDLDLVYVRFDEGVGGGVVEHGEAATGSIGAAGEIGHVPVDPLGARCACGGRGCLELVASLPAILRAVRARDLDDLRDRIDEPDVRAAVDRAATAAGGVVAGLLAIANPAIVAVGGAVATIPGFTTRLGEVARDASPDWATIDLLIEPAGTDRVLGAVGAATAAAATLDVLVPLRRKDA